jgi:hypothetical protein
MGDTCGLDLGGVNWWKGKSSVVDSSIVQRSGVGGVSWLSNGNGSGSGDNSSCKNWSSSVHKARGGDGANSSDWSWSRSYGQVGGSGSESVDRVSNVLNILNKPVSVNVGVSSSYNAIGGLGFDLAGWTTRITVGVLAKFILSMILVGSSLNGEWGQKLGRSHSQGRCKNDESTHFV